ncbi:MAG: hypothetical protein ACW99Q_11075, partial [Candidatus Kariarchaeaceae archaeon]
WNYYNSGIGMPKLKIKLHQSLRLVEFPFEFESEFNSGSIIDCMRDLLSGYPVIIDMCLTDKGRKPGLLYISGNTELASLGLLEHNLDEDLEIRIVPILHGG